MGGNEISGGADGITVQAGKVEGDVVIHAFRPAIVPRQLEAAAKRFVDRVAERRRLDAFRAAADNDGAPAVVVLRGLPGVGKTALALKWLHEILGDYADGQLHLPIGENGLGGAPDAERILDLLLHDLGADDTVAATRDFDAKARLFRSMTADRRLIVLLDDAVSAAQVEPVLRGGSRALVVITSTRRLNELTLDEADALDVVPMDDTAIAELLTAVLPKRCTRAASAEDIRRLAGTCHGFPQLARMAARTLSNDPEETVGRLAARMDQAGREADAMDDAARGPSLRGEIDAFVRNLSPAAAHLYRLLGLHPTAEFDRWAATAALGGDAAAARSGLTELWRNGLVDHIDGTGTGDADLGDGAADIDDRADTDGRYRMAEVVRDHARSGAHSDIGADDALAVRQGYIAYYVAGAIAAGARGTRRWMTAVQRDDAPDLPDMPTADAAWMWMRRNLAAILAVAEWAQDAEDHDPVWRIAEASDGFLREHGRYTDRTALMEMGIRSAQAAGNAAAEARLRNQLGLTLVELGRYAEAAEEFSLALSLSEGPGDGRGQAAALECLGIAAQRAGDDEAALGYFDRARPFKEAMGRPQAMAILALLRSRSLISLGRGGEALDPLAGAIDTFRTEDDAGGWDVVNEAKALLERGRALDGTGEPEQARIALRRALDIFAERALAYWQGRVREALARVERADPQSDDGAAYREHRDAARDLYRGIGNDAEAERVERELPGE
ncbi:tetratricopeptide repeat protein [Nocardiopsis sediminis]|uniref:Tetratricopeptide repeat protein n=1 Tax=Nocardiopsis sediminis TaxID=1778267 RepID=A0ABV8FS42_9ACTN